MTESQFEQFVVDNPHIEYSFGDEGMDFRNPELPWYGNHPENWTHVAGWLMLKLDPAGLLKQINRGYEVEGITRITGYFTKTSSWNKGKLGELRDRYKNEGQFSGASR